MNKTIQAFMLGLAVTATTQAPCATMQWMPTGIKHAFGYASSVGAGFARSVFTKAYAAMPLYKKATIAVAGVFLASEIFNQSGSLFGYVHTGYRVVRGGVDLFNACNALYQSPLWKFLFNTKERFHQPSASDSSYIDPRVVPDMQQAVPVSAVDTATAAQNVVMHEGAKAVAATAKNDVIVEKTLPITVESLVNEYQKQTSWEKAAIAHGKTLPVILPNTQRNVTAMRRANQIMSHVVPIRVLSEI